MKDKDMQKNFVEKLTALRKILAVRFPSIEMQNIIKLMSNLAHYHYNKKKFLIMGNEKELYDFLIEECYNPYTVYRWMLLERIPEDIRFQLREKRVSQKKAISKAFTRRHETDSSLAVAIKELGLTLVRKM